MALLPSLCIRNCLMSWTRSPTIMIHFGFPKSSEMSSWRESERIVRKVSTWWQGILHGMLSIICCSNFTKITRTILSAILMRIGSTLRNCRSVVRIWTTRLLLVTPLQSSNAKIPIYKTRRLKRQYERPMILQIFRENSRNF